MTLQNLLRIGKLKPHATTVDEIARLLASVDRNLADADAHALPLTLAVDNAVWIVLDALRRKRNAIDYTGEPVSVDMVDECVMQATRLRTAGKKAATAHARAAGKRST